MYNVTMRSVWVTIVAVENQQVLHILSVCVCVYGCVALRIQHAKHTRCIIQGVAEKPDGF